MFDALMVVCIAHSLSGEPDSQCVAIEADQIFRTYDACRSWADREEISRAYNGFKELQKPVIVQITCGEM